MAKYKAVLRFILIIVLSSVSLASCNDDTLYGRDSGVEGEDAVISLSISLPEMQVYSRADLPEGVDYEINNLWVGIFNANDKNCTFSKFYKASDLTPLTGHTTATLTNINTKSGNSYIVAVANVDDNTGVSSKGRTKKELRELLTEVEAYDDYLAIAVVSPGPGSVSTPLGNLPMSGIYYKEANKDPDSAIDWETLGDTPVYIPASKSTVKLEGAIHLRRLTSQIIFNLSVSQPSGSDKEIISLEPYQWQVFNVPEMTWLHERGDGTGAGRYAEGNPAGTTNAGDLITSIHEDKNKNYGTSDAYTSTYFTPSGDGIYTFDFWQMENKRVGVERCSEYSYREKRFDPDGKVHEGSEEGSYTESSAVYASLCNSVDDAFPNNLASYVQIKCRIKYKDKTAKDDPSYKYTELDDAFRTADVTYTIHLGYVDNSGSINDKAQDFRSLRNSIYTYNVKVTDVKNLILEAYRKEGEKQPGAEGIVADIKETDFQVDAHYQQFNISFTEQELKEISCLINTYYDGGLQIVQGKSVGSDYNVIEQYKFTEANKKFWDWVEFRATSGKDTFAEYKPVDYKDYSASDKQTFTLKTLCNLYTEESEKSSDYEKYVGTADNNGKYWFTVFVNENVYTDENKKEDPWPKFVNQSPRKLYINVKEAVASDGHTMYIKSKYAISQRSIQTYYSTAGSTPQTALGLEHVNESLGLRLRWTKNSNSPSENWDHTHGRDNLLQFLNIDTSPDWKDFVNVTEPFSTPEIKDGYSYSGSEHNDILKQSCAIPQKEAYLPSLVKIDQLNNVAGNGWYADPVTEYGGGNNEYYIHVINACMNRNRDLNGNGKIDAEEVRWYVPTSSRYLRMIIGARSLETPLMDFTETPTLTASSKQINGINNSNTRYHYATSDARIVWAEEGLAVSDWWQNSGDNGWIFGAWEVRCVRNLGANYDSQENINILPAYTVDTEKRTVVMDHYDSRSIRDVFYTRTPPVHVLTSALNSPYKAFEYDEKNSVVSDVSSIENWYDMLVERRDPCSQKGDGWRVPVMAELAIMRSIYGGTDYEMKNDETEDLFKQKQEGEVLLSCTKEYYSNFGNPVTDISGSNDLGTAPSPSEFCRFMGANFNQTYAVNVSDYQQGHTFYVRCVRDIHP